MTEPTKSASVLLAERALGMKRDAAKAAGPKAGGGRRQAERAAAARSASKSKPALSK